MRLKSIYFIALGIVFLSSCKKDDGITSVEVVPPRLLSEAATENDENIIEFLKTHFYNYEDFATSSADFDFKIKFDTIAGDNVDKISIFDSGQLAGVEFITETITLESSSLGRNDEEVVNNKFYVLIARQGISEKNPTIGDNVILRYEGSYINDTKDKLNKTLSKFDASSEQPILFNLSQVVRGFGNGLEYFKTGTGPIDNGDGTVRYDEFGIGVIFMPSGLGYFDNSNPNTAVRIPAYSPLIFIVDALDYEIDTDFDGDGIPSILEDVNGNGNLNDDNTDQELEQPLRIFSPNYNDTDDDGDGIPTIEEINLDTDGNFLSFKYTDGDKTPDHLNKDN